MGGRAHIRGEGGGQRDPYSQPRREKGQLVTSVVKEIKLFNGVRSAAFNGAVGAASRGGDAVRRSRRRGLGHKLPEDRLPAQKEQ